MSEEVRLKATLALEEPITRISGVSAKRASALRKLDIKHIRDLLGHFPKRYIDMSDVRTISDAAIGQQCTLSGTVYEMKLKNPKRNLSLVEITLQDNTGIIVITCFRQPWLMDKFKAGDRLAVSGKIEFNYGFKRMTNPYLEVLGDKQAHGFILPVYSATDGITQTSMRGFIERGLQVIRGMLDPLPLELRMKYRLMGKGVALSCVHFPHEMSEAMEARRRLAYEEVLLLQLFMMIEGEKRSSGKETCAHTVNGLHLSALQDSLPFTLTAEQASARDDLLDVMSQNGAANHMLLGDVGTGKTVVAAHGLAAAVDSGGQALLLAPTEVLAEQHFAKVGALLDAAGITNALLTGSTDDATRSNILDRFSQGKLGVLIGTHAILEDDVIPSNLTFVVIDEQQRFGVEQRAKLLSKGTAPDALYLTATPIPRTLALALFGNLTLSYIKERPNADVGRSTRVLPKSKRGVAYDAAKEALARGEQVYVVCPLIGVSSAERDASAKSDASINEMGVEATYHPDVVIEEDEDLNGGNVTAAIKEAEYLQKSIFPDYRVDLLHGGLPSADKREVMQRFSSGESHVLVATTVIEVGVDVPNATVMIVEDADRFGLSQLHQLRGRVGRGEKAGEVFLVSASKQEAALKRLSALEKTEDGYELATLDLSLRREGDILGNRQSGASALKLVNVVRDGAMIEAAHNDARAILNADPELRDPSNATLARELRITFSGERFEYAVVGG